MKVHILDDWFDTLRALPSFARLDGHDVTVWTDHVEDVDILADRLAAHCAQALPSIRRPRHFAVVDALPRHPNGKLRKVELRDEYRRRAAAQV